mgnify:CR=1 FL=1
MTVFDKDTGAYWMPFTPNRAFKKNPRIIESAAGMYYTTKDGQQILDGCAGLWCVNAGHGNDKINGAIKSQVDKMTYSPAFQAGHSLAFEFAERLAQLFPGDLNHAFFTNSGSESVDTALKIARAYQKARGKPEKIKLIGREKAITGLISVACLWGGLCQTGRPLGRCCRKWIICPIPMICRRTLFLRGNRPMAPIRRNGYWT